MTINCMWRGTNHEIVRQQLKTSSKQALTSSNNFLSANPEKVQFLYINPRTIVGDTSDAVLSLDGVPIDKSEDIKLKFPNFKWLSHDTLIAHHMNSSDYLSNCRLVLFISQTNVLRLIFFRHPVKSEKGGVSGPKSLTESPSFSTATGI